jgi:hypothetical protein
MTDPLHADARNGAFERRFDCECPFAEQAAELLVARAAGAELE